MDLLLTHGYFLREDAKEQAVMKPYAPLGILYLCSHLRARGFDVEVFDSTFRSREELYAILRSEPPAVLGVYANLMTRPVVIEMLQVAREAGWKTIVGGPEPVPYVREYLEHGADIVALGEGEHTLEELLPALRAGRAALERVHGIAFLAEDGSVRRTPPRPMIPNLDAQPWPAREAIDLRQYLSAWREHHGQASLALFCARGCPYHCRWCSRAVFGNTHRRRTPALVVDELEGILDRYHPEMVWMADDVFTIHHGWLFAYAAELKRRGLRVPFECISRADRLNEQVVATLAEMGCFRLWVGCESGSQRILDAMERGVTLGEVGQSIELLRSYGIASGMFLMWGYDGEELADIESTIQQVKRVNPDLFFTTVAYPIRGTAYHSAVAGRVVNEKDWAVTTDRDNRVRGRHSRRFYRHADRVLRAEVELHRRRSREEHDNETVRQELLAARRAMRETFAEVEA